MLAIAYSTEGGMMSFASAKGVSANLKRIQDIDAQGGGHHVIANLGLFPMDSITFRNDLHADFCPPDAPHLGRGNSGQDRVSDGRKPIFL